VKAIALAITIAGLHAVVSYPVSTRRRELTMRLALAAAGGGH